MHRYAIQIRKQDLELITLLNQGVTPVVNEKAFFVFDAEWNSEVPNEIVTEDELIESTEFGDRPIMYHLK